MSDNVISLAERKNDGMMDTPEQLLERCLTDIRSGKIAGSKAMVIILDDSREHYDPGWKQCGMRLSECVALLEIAKLSVHELMFHG